MYVWALFSLRRAARENLARLCGMARPAASRNYP